VKSAGGAAGWQHSLGLPKSLAAGTLKWKPRRVLATSTDPGSGPQKRTLYVVFAILGAMAVAWFSTRRGGLAALDAGQIRSVQIVLTPRQGYPPPPAVTTSDPAAISSLVEAIPVAEAQEDHKCMSKGTIEFIPSSGPALRLEFLPGHDDGRYEVRFKAKSYRMPRAPFVDAMRKLGVDVPLECF
jgi:hypothetical protein